MVTSEPLPAPRNIAATATIIQPYRASEPDERLSLMRSSLAASYAPALSRDDKHPYRRLGFVVTSASISEWIAPWARPGWTKVASGTIVVDSVAAFGSTTLEDFIRIS